MEPLEKINRLAKKTYPGRQPGFTSAYVIKALKIIKKMKIGRKNLSEELNLGEGIVRNLINRLIDEDIIKTDRTGMELTENGSKLLKKLNESIHGVEFPSADITVDEKNYAVLIRNLSGQIKNGIEQRDNALIAGASGASTLVCIEGEIKFPNNEIPINTHLADFIYNKLKPSDGDVVIIGTSDSALLAEIGAYTAALSLLEK